VAENVIYDNGRLGGAGINLDGVQDSRIENNLLYQNHATGIALFRGDGAEGSMRNVVVNNTIVNAADGRWAVTIANGSTHNTVQNNILYSEHSFRGGLDVDADSLLGLVSDYNGTENRFSIDGGDQILSLEQWRMTTGQDRNSHTSTPTSWFANASAHDYRLSIAGPAVNAGTSVLAPMLDLAGNPRPACALFDVGAYESPAPRGDINHDCRVDGLDLALVLARWGALSNTDSDLNGDGLVDGADVAIVYNSWTGDTWHQDARRGPRPAIALPEPGRITSHV